MSHNLIANGDMGDSVHTPTMPGISTSMTNPNYCQSGNCTLEVVREGVRASGYALKVTNYGDGATEG
jgi:hypothetical protein